jgi:osmoprotectant transport system permease protein
VKSTPRVDRPTALGVLCGLAALALPWLVLEPNRVARGTPLALWDSLGAAGAVACALPWLAALALGRGLPAAAAAVAAPVAAFAAALAAAAPAAAAAGPAARLAAGPGLYLALAGSYFVLLGTRGGPAAPRARRWTAALPWLAALASLVAVRAGPLALVREIEATGGRFGVELLNHLSLTAWAVGLATAAGVPLGIGAARGGPLGRAALAAVDAVQTVPSLALFGLIIVPLSWLSFRVPALRALGIRGIGAAPALLALTLYALLPIVRNTCQGVRSVSPAIREAGRGMGMSRLQLLARVELPLASRPLLEGVRIAGVQTIGNATVAALVGGGGLGVFVFQGLGQGAADLVLMGALPVALLAVAGDRAMGAIIARIGPREPV